MNVGKFDKFLSKKNQEVQTHFNKQIFVTKFFYQPVPSAPILGKNDTRDAPKQHI